MRILMQNDPTVREACTFVYKAINTVTTIGLLGVPVMGYFVLITHDYSCVLKLSEASQDENPKR